MKIKFIGVPDEDFDSLSMYGYDFPKGKFVDVQDQHAQYKLSKHPHFEVMKGEPPAPAPVAVEPMLVATDGQVTVTEEELRKIEEDPFVQVSGVKPTFEDVIEHKHATEAPAPKRGPGRPKRS